MVARDALPHLEPATTADLVTGAVLDGRELADADLTGVNAAEVRLLESLVRDCQGSACTLPGIRAVEVHVARLRAATLTLTSSHWRDCTFVEARVGALIASGAELTDVAVSASKCDLLSLRGAVIRRVHLEDCRIGTLDLSEADVRELTVVGGSVDELVTTQASLREVDVSRTELSIVSDVSALSGIVMSDAQVSDLAPAFAAHLGVRTRTGA